MKRVIKVYLLLISLFVFLPVMAKENNTIDLSNKGSINITLSDQESNKVIGAEIILYKLADATIKNNNLSFSYNVKLNNCKENIDNDILTNTELECILKSGISGISDISDKNGEINFDNLDLGLYLIIQNNQVENFSKITPFLLSIPTTEQDEWIYNISGTPKIELLSLFDLKVTKEWNVLNKDKIPNSVEVELLENGIILDKIILNEDNNWSYTWKQIAKSNSYSVREINIPAGFTPTYSSNENNFIITNSQTLVQTGHMPWIYNTLSLIGLFCIIIGINLDKRRKHEKK